MTFTDYISNETDKTNHRSSYLVTTPYRHKSHASKVQFQLNSQAKELCMRFPSDIPGRLGPYQV